MIGNKTEIRAEPGKQELFIEHIFDAPRQLVFTAFTDPDLYVQWLGPTRLEMRIEQFEAVSGGSYRYIHEDDEGNEYVFCGVYHEVTPPERIISTFEYEGLAEKGHVSLETAKFIDLPEGKTKLVAQAVYQSVEDRDGMIASGMEEGVIDSYARLDELLAKLMSE